MMDIAMFLSAYNQLKITTAVFSLPQNEASVSTEEGGAAMLHCPVSAVTQNGQTRHRLYRVPFALFAF